jgi:hypothetical protein
VLADEASVVFAATPTDSLPLAGVAHLDCHRLPWPAVTCRRPPRLPDAEGS